MAESLGNPYGPNGRAALALMKLFISVTLKSARLHSDA
jgi:hypothetical protein